MRRVLLAISFLVAFLMMNTILVLAKTEHLNTISPRQIIELDAFDSGWYSDSGFHGPDNSNYLVGKCYLPQCSNLVFFRNFFAFDLSEIPGEILTATLVIENPADGYNSSDQSETWTTFEVTTAVPTILAGGSGLTNIYDDLGSGPMFGDSVVTTASSLVEVNFNQSGIEVLNSKVGEQFALGGAITTLTEEDRSEWVFGNGDEENVRKLILHIGAPVTMTVNYSDGAPNSYFNVSGSGFPPNQVGTITINNTELTTVTVDSGGLFNFTLNTAAADLGYYLVTVSVNPSANIAFTLANDAPLRIREGNYIVYEVPSGIALTNQINLPLIVTGSN